MAKIGFLKRLILEDFKKDQQELVGRIAFILNPALEYITLLFNKGLNLSDLNVQVKTINISVDANGVPIQTTSFRSELVGRCNAMLVGKVVNTSTATNLPSSQPYVQYTEASGQIVIQKITNLNARDKYQITLIAAV